MRSLPPLVQLAMTGHKITLRDKIEAETSLEELNAMQTAIAGRGELLPVEDLHAFAVRRAELQRRQVR